MYQFKWPEPLEENLKFKIRIDYATSISDRSGYIFCLNIPDIPDILIDKKRKLKTPPKFVLKDDNISRQITYLLGRLDTPLKTSNSDSTYYYLDDERQKYFIRLEWENEVEYYSEIHVLSCHTHQSGWLKTINHKLINSFTMRQPPKFKFKRTLNLKWWIDILNNSKNILGSIEEITDISPDYERELLEYGKR